MQVTHLYSPCSMSEQDNQSLTQGLVAESPMTTTPTTTAAATTTGVENKTECKANCVAGPSKEALPEEGEKLLQPLAMTLEDVSRHGR